MNAIDNYFGFILACFLLNLVPGSDTIYILTRSISQGKKAGIFSVLGICSGILIHTLLAAFGLSLILSTSVPLYTIIKLLGSIYLIYLGIKMFVNKSEILVENTINTSKKSIKKLYFQGVITNVLNPKVALFFISFLPQFINTNQANNPFPFIILGLTFISTSITWCLILVFLSSFMSKALRTNKIISSYMQKISGSIFIILGLKIALERQ